MGLVRQYGLNVDEDAVRRRVTRRVVDFMLNGWIPYVSHYKLKRGHHAWRYPEKYARLTLAEAERKMEDKKADLRKANEAARAAHHAAILIRRREVQTLHEKGHSVQDIADAVEAHHKTIRADLDALYPDGPEHGHGWRSSHTV